MVCLKVLGAARIEGDEGRLSGEAVQRHRLALLALLSAARDATLPREKLMALLWPDQPAHQARHLLNVSVHVLRKALGVTVLRTEGGDLSLDTSVLPSDLVRFREALKAGDLRGAAQAYTGPLLDGFFLDDAPEFERWQDTERARLETEYADLLSSLAEDAERTGDRSGAVKWWRALAEQAPDNARVTVRLMQALEATGDRGAALQAADAHAALLAEELGAEPSPEVSSLAARIREQPAPVSLPSPDRSPVVEQSEVPAGPVTRPRGRLRWAVAGAGLALAVVAAIAFRPSSAADGASVAVLPFLDLSPAGDQAFMSDGLTEELLNALARVRGLRVAARSSSFQFREPGVDVRMVGRRLGVAAVVEGSVRLDGNRLRVTAQLIDTRRGYHLWSEQYDRDMKDIFAVQEDIARTVASALSAELVGRLPEVLVSRSTASPEAYQLYLRGRHNWSKRTRDGILEARRAFEEAITLDPEYAAAYAGLADAWQLMPDYGDVPAREGLARARTAALRAIALDSSLAEAHASLAALMDDYDHDRAGAEREYRLAIALNPGYVTARQWLAIHLADGGRFDEAIAEIERARRLDPLSRIINTAVGAIRYFARDYDAAIAEYQTVLDQAPDFALAWALMGRVYLVSGRAELAVGALSRSVDLSGGDPSYRAVYAAALAAAGRREEAGALARALRDVEPGSYVPYSELAAAFLYLDEDSTALDLFERGVAQRDPAVKHLRVEPLYDGIRAHPRFQALLGSLALRAASSAEAPEDLEGGPSIER
jgi:serine/threonine-protein kinase